MSYDQIDDAISAAVTFIKRARALKAKVKASVDAGHMYEYHPKESGACRRASMDLTRALADFRRPD